MYVRWHGQACFTLRTSEGTTIRIDPFDRSLGLPITSEPAEICLVTHEHADHNAVQLVPGNPIVIREPGTHRVGGVEIVGLRAYHDANEGRHRGEVTVFVIKAEGLTVVHLGDIGHVPGAGTVTAIGSVDVLCVPVGGTFTIDAEEATRVVELLAPRIAVPMHYRLRELSLPIDGVELFLADKKNVKRQAELEITAKSLPAETEIVVLERRV